MIRKKQSGFTLIETLSVLAIGGVIAANQIKDKNFELEDSLNKNVAKELSIIFGGIDARIEVDGNLANKWSSIPANLNELKSALRGVDSSCTFKSWNPNEVEYKTKSLIPCSGLLNNKVYGFDIDFVINDADNDGKIDKISASLVQGGRSFTQKNIRDFELLMKRFLESFDKNRIFFNARFKSVTDGSTKDLLTCLSSPTSCTPSFEFNADASLRNFDNDYVRLDGSNGIREGGLFFEQRNAADTAYEFKTCDKWVFDATTGNLIKSGTDKCGFTHNGYIFLEKDLHAGGSISTDNVNSNTATLGDKLIFKSKNCNLKTNNPNNTLNNSSSYNCGLYKSLNGSGEAVLLTESVNSEDAYINTGYIQDLFSNEIRSEKIFSTDISNSNKITTKDLVASNNVTSNTVTASKFIDKDNGIYVLDPHLRSKLNSADFSRDGLGPCCGDKGTISLSEYTANTGRTASISLHNGGVAEGNIELADTRLGGSRRIRFYDNQNVLMGIEATGGIMGHSFVASSIKAEGTNCSTPGAIVRGTNDKVLSCKNGKWEDQEDCPRWSGNLNYLQGSSGGDKGCINGVYLGNRPTGTGVANWNWFWVDYVRHGNNNNYYTSQVAKGMTGGAAGRIWTRSQQSSTSGIGWGPWREITNEITGSITSNGSVDLGKGLILKWGQGYAAGNRSTYFRFPSPFPNNTFSVVTTPIGVGNGGGTVDYWGVYSITRASFYVSNQYDGARYFKYIAIGN